MELTAMIHWVERLRVLDRPPAIAGFARDLRMRRRRPLSYKLRTRGHWGKKGSEIRPSSIATIRDGRFQWRPQPADLVKNPRRERLTRGQFQRAGSWRCFLDATNKLPAPKCLDIKKFISFGKIPAAKSLFGAFPTLCQHTESVARSVSVMVFVERIVPPAAVLFLWYQDV